MNFLPVYHHGLPRAVFRLGRSMKTLGNTKARGSQSKHILADLRTPVEGFLLLSFTISR